MNSPLQLRDAWREHPLDGARLWFHPASGTHVRRDGPETRGLRRTAPRAALFGITNRCNLTCSFCSRDLAAPSEWTADSAFDLLRGLAARGLLEVAFGGGEPLAFRGFDDLVERLGRETPLAVHLTTNGTLLDPARLERLRPYVGELRLSIYDDVPWEERVALLAASGLRFGVNLLVTAPRVGAVATTLVRLAALGCPEVALLRYVGHDPALHLGADAVRTLAEVAAASPVRTKLSVCFGDQLPGVPRFGHGAGDDCGAGLDFVVLTSDRRLKACSFHEEALPVASADDVLRVWRERQARLASPSRLPGCARLGGTSSGLLPDGVRVWRAFSGNNSGECVLVGRFEAPDDARRFVDDLRAGFAPGASLPGEWLELFDREGVPLSGSQYAPHSMAAVGTTALFVGTGAGDEFPSLRSLLWRRGGRALYHGIHVHERVDLLAGLGFTDERRLAEAEEALASAPEPLRLERRGLDLLGLVPGGLAETLTRVEAAAAEHGASLAGEVVAVEREVSGLTLGPRLPAAGPERLWCSFPTPEAAAAAAGMFDGAFPALDRYLLVEAEHVRPRSGWMVHRHGGLATLVRGPRLGLTVTLGSGAPRGEQEADLQALVRRLRESLRAATDRWLADHGYPGWSVGARLETSAPEPLVRRLLSLAADTGARLWLEGHAPDPLAAAVDRVAGELDGARRRS